MSISLQNDVKYGGPGPMVPMALIDKKALVHKYWIESFWSILTTSKCVLGLGLFKNMFKHLSLSVAKCASSL